MASSWNDGFYFKAQGNMADKAGRPDNISTPRLLGKRRLFRLHVRLSEQANESR